MRKSLILLAASLLALAGCQKEQAGNQERQNGSNEVTASFTVSLPEAAATKAAADGDGAAASVNRCKMQIWWKTSAGDEMVVERSAAVADLKAEFKDITLIKGQDYDFLFWADDATLAGGVYSDLYYTTTDLHDVTLKTAYVGNNDARDAFFAARTMTDLAATFKETVDLHRPFAQLNIITTDVKTVYDQLPATDRDAKFAKMMPEATKVTFSAPAEFNVLTGKTIGSDVAFTSDCSVYKTQDPTKAANSLTMDYIFASESESKLATITFTASNTKGLKDVERTYTNIPIQRNWRTNIKGPILTCTGEFYVEVVPAWTGEKDVDN